MVQSSEVVGGIVHDFVRLWNGDVDCLHYLRREVTPVKFLQEGWETKAYKREAGRGKEATDSDRPTAHITCESTSMVKLALRSPSSILL